MRTPVGVRAASVAGLALVAGILTASCGGEGGPAADGSDTGAYGLGRAPSAGELAAWNTAIGPEGEGLPPGRGTVAEGARLYAAQCASCHGRNGEGIAPAYPALIGRAPAGEAFRFAEDPAATMTIGNYWPHATTVFDYIRRAMPQLTPGTLTDEQTYALTAYLLAANDVIPDTATLDADALRAVRMPARDRFVVDDRPNGPGIR